MAGHRCLAVPALQPLHDPTGDPGRLYGSLDNPTGTPRPSCCTQPATQMSDYRSNDVLIRVISFDDPRWITPSLQMPVGGNR